MWWIPCLRDRFNWEYAAVSAYKWKIIPTEETGFNKHLTILIWYHGQKLLTKSSFSLLNSTESTGSVELIEYYERDGIKP